MPLLDIRNLTIEFKTGEGWVKAVDRIRRITSVVGATASVSTGNTIWRRALTIISWRHTESDSHASMMAKPVTVLTV